MGDPSAMHLLREGARGMARCAPHTPYYKVSSAPEYTQHRVPHHRNRTGLHAQSSLGFAASKRSESCRLCWAGMEADVQETGFASLSSDNEKKLWKQPYERRTDQLCDGQRYTPPQGNCHLKTRIGR